MKIGLLANVAGHILAFLLIAIAEAAGWSLFDGFNPGNGLIMNLVAAICVGILFGLLATLPFIAGAFITRLLWRRRPTLEVRDHGAELARHFE